MTSWNRRLNAASTRPTGAGDPAENETGADIPIRSLLGARVEAPSAPEVHHNANLLAPKPKAVKNTKPARSEVLADALAAGVVEDDLSALMAMANIARSRPGFHSSLQVRARRGTEVLDREYEILFDPDGPIVREGVQDLPSLPARPERRQGDDRRASGAAGVDDDLASVLAQTLMASPDLVGVFGAVGGAAFWLNESFTEIAPVGEGAAATIFDMIDPSSALRFRRDVLPGIDRWGTWRGPLNLVTGDDRRLVVSAVVVGHRDSSGHVDRVALVARPIAGEEAERGFEDGVDILTGLPGRSAALAALAKALLQTDLRSVVVLLVDLDHMRAVNEHLGHEVGDEVLRQCAARLRDQIGNDGFVARAGSDEFAVVLPGVGAGDGLVEAIRVREALSASIDLASGPYVVTVSVGMAVKPTAADVDPEAVLRDAERAVLQAKASGRDRIEVYTEELAKVEVRRLTAGQALRRALDEDNVQVHYQPIVDLATGDIVAVEALLRVHGDDGDPISPADFVDAAESSGLITRLGTHVLGVTCRQLADWATDPASASGRRMPAQISVNVSPRQLADPDLPSLVLAAIEASGIDPGQLWLEITESTIIGAQGTIDEGILYLRELGVKIGLDDFGAGQSSLAYLKRFPLDFVKIDRSLVSGVGHEERDTAIVRATVELAHNLGLTVFAVGVESAEQLDLLRQLGCDRAQGHHFAPAMSVEALEGLCRD